MKKKTVYKYVGVTTGRVTGGLNFSFIPKEDKNARALFIPDKKKIFIQSSYPPIT